MNTSTSEVRSQTENKKVAPKAKVELSDYQKLKQAKNSNN